LALAGCQFDASGFAVLVPVPRVDAASAPADAAAADALALDAAATPCADTDRDGFSVATTTGVVCGPADCDDGDPRAFPGQTRGFTTPRARGGFDFDCDGVDRPLADQTQGGECQRPPFSSCQGTGWLGDVPRCGERGVWHRCASADLACRETERVELIMPCI
jgi:hypothetical protein